METMKGSGGCFIEYLKGTTDIGLDRIFLIHERFKICIILYWFYEYILL